MVDDAPDPTVLYRVRDGVYAGDLLIAAVAGRRDSGVLLARKPG